ncbi:hypothetical protein SISSUDRAFT_1067977 [Sistotremastrum suecicum HHB10207 ss-3]|uniref:WW domain-containing protein n=1 Tax=Sistotremastrum suecicum HHB10207 ss-3 TaxID=1314776 RepID=A0A165WIP8_9AGAM|nr:hypothetical protein SISSUDRAFT_1067977 [Sistotremastrum suecicum HHB10207 ss-3]
MFGVSLGRVRPSSTGPLPLSNGIRSSSGDNYRSHTHPREELLEGQHRQFRHDLRPVAPGTMKKARYRDKNIDPRSTFSLRYCLLLSRPYRLTRSIQRHYHIPQGLFVYSDEDLSLPPIGWTEQCHPEGQTYWCHFHKKIVTAENMRDPLVAQTIVDWITKLEELMAVNSHTLGNSRELVVGLGSNNACEYYLVDHSQQLLYWIEQTDTPLLGLPAVSSISHLRLLLRQQYYVHLELFCMHVGVTQFVQDRLMSTLAFYCIDGMTSMLSTSPYAPGQCQKFLHILGGVPTSNAAIGYKTFIVARLLAEIYGAYFIHFRGEASPRLARSQRLFPQAPIHTDLWYHVVNTILWCVPMKHCQNLQNQWIDKLCNRYQLQDFLRQMSLEWSSSVYYSTGMILYVSYLSSASANFSATF